MEGIHIEKTCLKHGLLKREDIYIDRGKFLKCKICRKNNQRKFKQNNKEKLRLESKKYHEANRERINLRQIKLRRSNPEKYNAMGRRYKKNNPEKVKAYNSYWNNKNRERVRIKNKKRVTKEVLEMPDKYIKSCMQTNLKIEEIPKEYIEARRTLLKLKRKLKEKK